MAVRILCPRPLAGQPQADCQPGPPLRILSADQPRRPGIERGTPPPTSCTSAARATLRGTPASRSATSSSPRASAWRTASAKKGLPCRLRPDLGSAALRPSAARPLSFDAYRIVGPDRQHVRLVQHDQRRHSGYRHAGRQQGLRRCCRTTSTWVRAAPGAARFIAATSRAGTAPWNGSCPWR